MKINFSFQKESWQWLTLSKGKKKETLNTEVLRKYKFLKSNKDFGSICSVMRSFEKRHVHRKKSNAPLRHSTFILPSRKWIWKKEMAPAGKTIMVVYITNIHLPKMEYFQEFSQIIHDLSTFSILPDSQCLIRQDTPQHLQWPILRSRKNTSYLMFVWSYNMFQWLYLTACLIPSIDSWLV